MTNSDDRMTAFGRRLRKLRAEAGWITGKEFAIHLGWPQSKVSRLENGKQTATDTDLSTWCEATAAAESVASELQDELRAIRIEAATWRRQLRTGYTDRQQRARAVEKKSGRIRAFEMALLPGLVQTAEYSHAVLTTSARQRGLDVDVSDAVRVRMDRQQVLYDSGKRIEILITEPTLHYAIGSPEVMVGQLDRLMTLAGLPVIRFGIIPLGCVLPVIPMHGFWIFDDDSVIIETSDSEIIAEASEDIALYHHICDLLWLVAAEGADARAILISAVERWNEQVRRSSSHPSDALR